MVASIDDRVHSLEAKSDATEEEIRELAMEAIEYIPRLVKEGTPSTAYVTGQESFKLQDMKF